jgi:hypothetical protein
MSEAVVEPVPEPLRRLLRRAVLDLAEAERRRRWFPPTLHVGVPGGTRRRFEAGEDLLDHALRVDVVEAMIRSLGRALGPPLVWLTRPGPLLTEDADLEWLAATRTASAELGITTRFVVVGRRAWVDPVSGVGRSWPRPPRQRS